MKMLQMLLRARANDYFKARSAARDEILTVREQPLFFDRSNTSWRRPGQNKRDLRHVSMMCSREPQ
jgi:hypothetical protein